MRLQGMPRKLQITVLNHMWFLHTNNAFLLAYTWINICVFYISHMSIVSHASLDVLLLINN